MPRTVRRALPGIPPFHDNPRRACRDHDTSLFFPEPCLPGSGPVEAAKAVCQPCPLIINCLKWATDTHQDHGIWAATTPIERKGAILPEPPPRTTKPIRRTINITHIFNAAQDRETNGGTLPTVAARHGINRTCLAHAVAVLQHAPHLIPNIEAGWYGLETAYRHATAIRRATQGEVAA